VFSYFILGIALLAGLLLAGRWFATADPKAVIKAVRWLLLSVICAVAVFFVVTGRLAWAFYTLPALIPWFMRARAAHRVFKTFSRMTGHAAGAATGQSSDVETRFLRMTLDHDSGEMTGDVLEGPHAGRPLDALSLDELVDLLDTCRAEDTPSARVLEAYLDRVHPEWRDRARAEQAGGAQPGHMTRAEALQVLGLDEGAGKEEIKAAHHRLISGLHPDHGGSTYLAAQINRAKDVLLGG